jgi:hypothetical protein
MNANDDKNTVKEHFEKLDISAINIQNTHPNNNHRYNICILVIIKHWVCLFMI